MQEAPVLRALAAAGAALISSLTLPAAAQEASDAEAAEPQKFYWVDFEAGQVDLDVALEELELQHEVRVRVDRYRLTSDRIKLRRGPRGIELEGKGQISFCPCPDPPVSVGFSGATVAPPTDLLVENPTLRIGDVPVLWLPYFWLRSENRLGLLPPRVAWRGEDGLLLGSGVHVPFGDKDARGKRRYLDLYASGYVEGGAEVEGRYLTQTSTTDVRWDRLGDSLLALDARGANGDRDATLAWQVDAVRGARGRRATLELEPAARRYDRGAIAVVHSGSSLVGGVALESDAVRGESIRDTGNLGPLGLLGLSGRVDDAGSFDASLDAATHHDPELQTSSIARQAVNLELDARPGPLALRFGLGERSASLSTAASSRVALRVAADTQLSLPLVRRFGGRSGLSHWIEPTLGGGGALGLTRDPFLQPPGLTASHRLEDAASYFALAGLNNSLGSPARRSAASLGLRAGVVGDQAGSDQAATARLLAGGESVGAAAVVAWLPRVERALATSARLRLGAEDQLHLETYGEGRLQNDVGLARALDSWQAPIQTGYYDRDGFSLGSRVGLPWTSFLASSAGADWAPEDGQLLAWRTSLAYRHPCGCLAAVAGGGQRLGRDGVDVWLSLDLIP